MNVPVLEFSLVGRDYEFEVRKPRMELNVNGLLDRRLQHTNLQRCPSQSSCMKTN
jgi:hypothetical protein